MPVHPPHSFIIYRTSDHSTMLTHIFICLCIAKLSIAQLNGEFWWLNDKLSKFNPVRPPLPKFENISEFDNDENAKIVFRDDNEKIITPIEKWDNAASGNIIIWPTETDNYKYPTSKPNSIKKLVFKFPKDTKDSDDITTQYVAENSIENNSVLNYDKAPSTENKEKESDNICKFMTKAECYKNNGLVHKIKYAKKLRINLQLICCIFPTAGRNKYASPKIFFPNDLLNYSKRCKRSTNESITLKQRNFLLKHIHGLRSKEATTERIVTPDYEYGDPYWNIKIFRNSKKQDNNNKKYDYDSGEYKEDYVDEIPRPGFTGLYSDHGQIPSSWPSPNKHEGYGNVDDYYDEDLPGYSTVDPRKVSAAKFKKKPVILATTSDESYNVESQTISYQSSPDFNVLQGFKLRLKKNKIKPSNMQRRIKTVNSIINKSNESSES